MVNDMDNSNDANKPVQNENKGKKGKIKEYFDIELVSTLIHTITGIIAGYLSFLVNSTIAVVLMIVILAISIGIVKFSLKVKQNAKWWLGNGVIVYILVWLIVWTLFYNIAIR